MGFSPRSNLFPPAPPIQYDARLQALTEKASGALGRLDSVATHLPSPELLLYTYIRKEAVLSSQIEGSRASLADLLLLENEEAPGAPPEDVRGVSNYVAALEHGVKRLRDLPPGIPLLREVHAILLPGSVEFATPPALDAFEKFIQGEPSPTPTLIKAGLAHAQFENIRPFQKGNGRLGRMLITLILISEGTLSAPLLYLSLYFKARQAEYFEALRRVRTDGDWEGWLAFYLTGVAETAGQASDAATKLTALFQEHAAAVEGLGRSRETALRAHDLFKKRCILSIPVVSRELGVSFPTANKTLRKLQQLGFVREITGKQRHRVFSYAPYLQMLREESEWESSERVGFEPTEAVRPRQFSRLVP